MKGDDFINSVELIFFGLGCNNNYQAEVKIYNGKFLIVNKKTYNGRLKVCLKPNKKYLLIAKSKYDIINTVFYILVYQDKYYFTFNSAYYQVNTNNRITFLLTDYNYIDLPIEKGEMILWQKQ